jgi:hypothetical protein
MTRRMEESTISLDPKEERKEGKCEEGGLWKVEREAGLAGGKEGRYIFELSGGGRGTEGEKEGIFELGVAGRGILREKEVIFELGGGEEGQRERRKVFLS